MQKIYIAGASGELDRAEQWMHQARARGFVITYDWTGDIRNHAGTLDRELPRHARRRYARQDIEGVTNAEAFWLLAPHESVFTSGAWVELGTAICIRDQVRSVASSYSVVVSGAGARRSIFTELADHVFDTDDAAFTWLQSKLRMKSVRP